MGILRSISSGVLHVLGSKRDNLRNPSPQLLSAFGSTSTSTGISVNQDTALRYSPVWAAVNIIGGAVGYLPFRVFNRDSDGDKSVAVDDPANKILHDQSNPHMTAQVFRETLTGHVLLWGNAYAEIERNGNGDPVAMWPIRPDRVSRLILSPSGDLTYEIRSTSGESALLPSNNVFHLLGLGSNGYTGYSVIDYHREAIGLGMAAEKYGARFFGNNARPDGVLQTPERLSEDAWNKLRARWEASHKGLDNSHRMALLEEGVTWQAVGVPAKDSQLLETRRFEVGDVARIYQVPLHMLSEMSRATFSNIEHQGIEFVQYTLVRWLKKFENEANRKLLRPSPRQSRFAEFTVEGLLRGDSDARSKFYREMFNNGFMTINEVRRLENLNKIDGDGGDTHFVNAALVPVDQAIQEPEPEPVAAPVVPDGDESDDARMIQAHQGHFEELWERILLKEHKSIRKAANNPDRFGADAEDIYSKLMPHICQALTRSVQVYALSVAPNASRAVVGGYVRDMAEEYCRDQLSQRANTAKSALPGDSAVLAGVMMTEIKELQNV